MATVIYDFETSGLNPYHDDITEIGCVCLETNTHYTTLVKPLSDNLLSEENQRVTGITNKMLYKQGKEPLVAFLEFFDYLKGLLCNVGPLTLIAHNGRSFDDIFFKRIHSYLVEQGHTEFDPIMKDIQYIDSLLLSRYLYPNRSKYAMWAMCGLFNITNENAHRAMGDVNALTQIWKELMKQFSSKHHTTDLTQVIQVLY
tara:strand:- start:114 stop:713 length:600 start_codon:yes stop_codon:yes gene_type:complete